MRAMTLAAAMAASVMLSSGVSAQTAPSPALSGPASRPAGDAARDELRHPFQVMGFAGVKPGDTVIELIPGGGYYTRLLSARVGATGKVFAVVPSFLAQRSPKAVDQMRVLAAEPGYGNVAVVVEGLGSVTDQGPADVVWTAQNYHDLHNSAVPADTALKVDQAVFAALKPGGVYLIEDHVAAAGSGARDAGTLHRIDPEVVKAEVGKAGFRYEGQSSLVANPADPHSTVVFDPSIRGRTDQFLLLFRKPG